MRSACFVQLAIIAAAVPAAISIRGHVPAKLLLAAVCQECHAYTRKKSVVQPRGLHTKSAKHNTFRHAHQLETHDTPSTHDTPAHTELETHDTPAHTEIDVCEGGNLNAEGGRCQHERVVQHPNAKSMTIIDIFSTAAGFIWEVYFPSKGDLINLWDDFRRFSRTDDFRYGVGICILLFWAWAWTQDQIVNRRQAKELRTRGEEFLRIQASVIAAGLLAEEDAVAPDALYIPTTAVVTREDHRNRMRELMAATAQLKRAVTSVNQGNQSQRSQQERAAELMLANELLQRRKQHKNTGRPPPPARP